MAINKIFSGVSRPSDLSMAVSYVFDENIGDSGAYRPIEPSDFSGGGGGGGGDASAANQLTEIDFLSKISGEVASIDSKIPSLGQATMVNSSPVVIASNQSAVPVSFSAGATAANQTTQLTRFGNITDAAVIDPAASASLIALNKGILSYLKSIQPASNLFNVTPSDSVDFTSPVNALWVGTGGDINIQIGSNSATLLNVPSGTKLDVKATRVNEAGTTASDIVGFVP